MRQLGSGRAAPGDRSFPTTPEWERGCPGAKRPGHAVEASRRNNKSRRNSGDGSSRLGGLAHPIDDVKPELGFDDVAQFVDGQAKRDLIESGDHLTRTKQSQISATTR